jgi:hypothetical protein
MIETDLKKLADQSVDHPLDKLNADIWTRVAARERARSLSKLLVASQALVLTLALSGSVIAGLHWSTASAPEDVGIFSPRSTWVASTLLIGDQRR